MSTSLAELADRIETELRFLGRWSDEPLDPARLVEMGPFGMNTLAAEEWIQHVLLRRLRDLAERGEPLPKQSDLAAWATRQLDGDGDATKLITLLRSVDELATEHPVAALIERTIALGRRLPMVRAAYVVQFYAPHSGHLTTPAVALEINANLPPDAFADWPKTSPAIVFGLGSDPLSNLARLTTPVYQADDGESR